MSRSRAPLSNQESMRGRGDAAPGESRGGSSREMRQDSQQEPSDSIKGGWTRGTTSPASVLSSEAQSAARRIGWGASETESRGHPGGCRNKARRGEIMVPCPQEHSCRDGEKLPYARGGQDLGLDGGGKGTGRLLGFLP